MAGVEELAEVGEGTAGVEDVLDNDDVAAFNAAVDILLDLDDAGAAGGSVPTAHLHELELAFAAEFPKDAGEVAEEMDGALEDAEQDDRRVGLRDAGADKLG